MKSNTKVPSVFEVEENSHEWDKWIQFSMSMLHFQSELCLNGLGRGNEATRVSYINDILRPALAAANKDKVLKLAYEHSFPRQRNDSWGAVEFVLCANTAKGSPVAKIIQAKQRDFERARGQLYVEIHLSFLQNLEYDKKADFPIFGAMTDASSWIFVRYDGKSFVESEPFLIKSVNDEAGIKAVFNLMVDIIKKQVQHVAPLWYFTALFELNIFSPKPNQANSLHLF
jgi:hypothetical protein